MDYPQWGIRTCTTRNPGLGGVLKNAAINGILQRFKLALLNSDVMAFLKHCKKCSFSSIYLAYSDVLKMSLYVFPKI